MARMTNAELLEFNKNREVCQICLVTNRDVEEVLDEWVDKLQVGPWLVCDMNNESIEYCGWGDQDVTEPFKFTCALAMYGNIQIEILKKHYGTFPGQKFLDEKGEGLQHFKEKITDDKFDAAVKRFEDAGLEKTWWGGLFGDKFCNFDSDKYVGFTFEIGNCYDMEMPKEYCYIYPREEE